MSDLYEHLYYSTLDFKTMSQLQRLVSAYRPHGTAAYQDLTGADRKDEKNIDAEVKAREKLGGSSTGELTTRLKNIITSVDGNVDRSYINNFVDNEFLSIDSLEFRKHMATVTPDIDMTTKIMVDGEETEVTIPVTVRFFWPSTGI